MQACGYLALGPTSFDGGKLIVRWSRRRPFTASAALNHTHYDVLGLLPNASSSEIKRAYRLLALKYHPDVNKEVGANEDFKSVRLAYEILINESARSEYDKALRHQPSSTRPLGDEWSINQEYEDGLRLYRWAYLRRKMQRDKYWEKHHNAEEDCDEEERPDEERGSFFEVVRSAFLSLFLMQTVGVRLSLTFSSLMALVDQNLDAGYKFGYLIAWMVGGRGGILLTIFLSFASWVCGKTSSGVVALVVVAMWFGSNVARCAPIPQDLLVPISAVGDEGLWFKIERESDPLFKKIQILRNTYRAVIEIYVSSHDKDEFWYSNPPDSYLEINNIQTKRGHGSYREIIVKLDDNVVGAVIHFRVI